MVFQEAVEQLSDHFCQRNLKSCFGCSIQDIGMVFGLGLDLPPGSEVTVKHTLSMKFQNTALCKSASDCLTHCRRISTSSLRQQHGLSHNGNRPPDNQLVAEFRNLSTANRPNQSWPPKNLEQGPCP